MAPQALWGRGGERGHNGQQGHRLPGRRVPAPHMPVALSTAMAVPRPVPGLPSPQGALILTSPGASQARFRSMPKTGLGRAPSPRPKASLAADHQAPPIMAKHPAEAQGTQTEGQARPPASREETQEPKDRSKGSEGRS